MFRKIAKNMQDFTMSMSRKNISAFSASTAFFLFLSLVPMLAVICAILPYTSLTEENLLSVIVEYVPASLNPIVGAIVEDVYLKSAGCLP